MKRSSKTTITTGPWPAPTMSAAELLALLVDYLDDLETDAPGHDHDIPGIWDNDNGEKSGEKCYWCALWAAAKGQIAKKEAETATHPDNIAVDRFVAEMKSKLAKKREQGRGGWEDKSRCSAELLSSLLREHVEKGDPVDVANLAMMLHQRGERITPALEGPKG